MDQLSLWTADRLRFLLFSFSVLFLVYGVLSLIVQPSEVSKWVNDQKHVYHNLSVDQDRSANPRQQ